MFQPPIVVNIRLIKLNELKILGAYICIYMKQNRYSADDFTHTIIVVVRSLYFAKIIYGVTSRSITSLIKLDLRSNNICTISKEDTRLFLKEKIVIWTKKLET